MRSGAFDATQQAKAVRICRDCARAWKRAYRARTRERQQEINLRQNLRSKYGISPEQYQALGEEQDWRCAICLLHVSELPSGGARGRPRLDGTKPATVRPLVVDHDHACCSGSRSCGRCIRGLICASCNAGLGMFRDDVGTLLRAAHYVDAIRT